MLKRLSKYLKRSWRIDMENLISICIPTYNGEKYIREALQSIKDQTYPNIEVIISNDNYQDKTLSICEDFRNDVNFYVFIYSL